MIWTKIKVKIISFLTKSYFYTNSNPLYRSSYLQIGDFTYGNPKILSWNEGSYLKIGKYCSIADNVTIFMGGEHRVDWVTTYPFSTINQKFSSIKGHPKTKGDIIIGNDVWIGANATIMSGVNTGDGAVIAAGSLVVKDIQPYEIVGGNPAHHIRFRFSQEAIESLLKIAWWNFEQAKIESLIPFLLCDDIHTFIEKNEKK
jgi:acetyltransferase-like isoleucine patch superfamily enzyme